MILILCVCGWPGQCLDIRLALCIAVQTLQNKCFNLSPDPVIQVGWLNESFAYCLFRSCLC